MRTSLMLLLSLLAAAAWSAPVSVPLMVTPPAPAAFTQQVSQPVTVNGVSYTVTGALTFTPIATNASLPAGGGNPVPASFADLPDGALLPLIAGFKGAAGAWQDEFLPGDPVYIEGRGWGTDWGLVRLGSDPCDLTEWLDEEIGITVPLAALPAPDGAQLEVRRPDGASVVCQGFRIGAAPDKPPGSP